jgi:hypothetical protein
MSEILKTGSPKKDQGKNLKKAITFPRLKCVHYYVLSGKTSNDYHIQKVQVMSSDISIQKSGVKKFLLRCSG